MKAISNAFFKMPVICIFFLGIPVFLFLFVLSYSPFNLEEFLSVGQDKFTLYLLVVTLIVLGVLVISRMLMFILRSHLVINLPQYILWCVLEIVAAGLFMSIPMAIGWSGVYPYFTVMNWCVLYLAGILVYPYAIITLAVYLHDYYHKAAAVPFTDEKKLIRFQDENKRLKLIVSSDAVLYIEAEENYVHIIHLDNGRVKDFTLRSSMRALEELLSRHSLVRCHRSYYVNPSHVDLVKKDVNGFALAQLDRDGIKPVPVSRRYYDALSAML